MKLKHNNLCGECRFFERVIAFNETEGRCLLETKWKHVARYGFACERFERKA